MKSNPTKKFAVLDLPSVSVDHVASADHGKSREQGKSRATKESGARMANTGHIGGPFTVRENPEFLATRAALFDQFLAESERKTQERPDEPISITLPDGTVKSGLAFKTSPYDVALSIAKGLADSIIIAKVAYTRRLEEDTIVACDNDEEETSAEDQANVSALTAASQSALSSKADDGELWDITRPLVGDCHLKLLKFDSEEGKTVFWHSSAHILGAALESVLGCHLTIGPALQNGFYYDAYMGNNSVADETLKKIDSKASEICKKKYPFQRLVLTKDQALEMFAMNPFKVNLIKNKVPDGAMTTVYRCGHLVDLCMGPHVSNTGKIKAFASVKTSSTNWLGQVTNDPLQRVYGIAFPDKAQLKKWQEFQEQAKQRDHRTLGTKQELFFFHSLSPGSAFWMPHGARIYNRLMDFIKKEYWKRGYEEVITPNVFNLQLWETSGHAAHYKDNMFVFDVEGQEWGMKPMNCPGHCLLFAHRLRSYRELPLRVADFGVLHRNEVSGALTGLTRVRRFQQDDAHIFCRQDQIKAEVLGALDFMKHVYTVLGMTYKLDLSTRPAKALGDMALWDVAEAQLAEALDEFAGAGNWRVNAGDGAFYGPKIDIKVFDAMDRMHQCATVQLDFQLPIRFDLQYKTGGEELREGDGEKAQVFQRPVMVHRAMLGSVERMSAVLAEHWGGKWPFWVSPRQAIVVPVDPKFNDYAFEVQQAVHEAGFFIDVDDSTRTLKKKVREAQIAQYNFVLVVGPKEVESKTVTVRSRDDDKSQPTYSIAECLEFFHRLTEEKK